ncbi:hypothetical protein ACP4OV_022503 [Aristida adscensionis]
MVTRNRRRRRLRAEAASSSSPLSSSSPSSSSPPQSSSSSSDRSIQPKIPLSDREQQRRQLRARRPLLLGLIRGHYLDAISRLPAAELSTTLAPGLFLAGHCYGPLHPVHNIILNTVWYAAAFPCRADPEHAPINTAVITHQGLTRLVERSLDGLVAALRYHCPALSHDDALWHLCLSGADLHAAAASARGAVTFARAELQAFVFQAAAKAARHPQPAALAVFATSPLQRDALSLLAGKRSLSSPDIARLSAMLIPSPIPDQPPPTSPPSDSEHNPMALRIIKERRRLFKGWYQTFLDVADAALRKFARQTGARYCLHTIYHQSIVEVDEFLLDRYFHIKFMAWPNGSSARKSQTPVRFFAEAHRPPNTNCPEEAITLCYMLVHVDSCYPCVTNNRKIDHPNAEEHFGGHPYKAEDTKKKHDWPSTIDVDYRFFDPDRDRDLIEYYADIVASREAMCYKYSDAEDDTDEEDTKEDDTDEEDTKEKDISGEDFCDEEAQMYIRRYI